MKKFTRLVSVATAIMMAMPLTVNAETLIPMSETKTETLIPMSETKTETLIPMSETKTETLIPMSETKTETLIPMGETKTETLIPMSETKTETLIPMSETKTETLVPMSVSKNDLLDGANLSEVLEDFDQNEINNAAATKTTLHAYLNEETLEPTEAQAETPAEKPVDILEEYGDDAAEVAGLTLPVIHAYNDDDVELLAKLIWHESEAEPRNGKIAVAEVILNRINSNYYPNTVSDVIYQKGQFSHVSGVKNEKPDLETVEIAREVLNGDLRVLNNSEVLYFRNPKKTSGLDASEPRNWGRHKYFRCYGNHAFYTHTPYEEAVASANNDHSNSGNKKTLASDYDTKNTKTSVVDIKHNNDEMVDISTENALAENNKKINAGGRNENVSDANINMTTVEVSASNAITNESAGIAGTDKNAILPINTKNSGGEKDITHCELTEEERLKQLHAEIEADRLAEVEAVAANNEATQAAVDAAVAQAVADEKAEAVNSAREDEEARAINASLLQNK